MRGSDIDYNPVFFAYLIVTMDTIYMFVDKAKLPSNYTEHLEENQVKIELLNYNDIRDKLATLVSIPLWCNYPISKLISVTGPTIVFTGVDKLIVQLLVDCINSTKQSHSRGNEKWLKISM